MSWELKSCPVESYVYASTSGFFSPSLLEVKVAFLAFWLPSFAVLVGEFIPATYQFAYDFLCPSSLIHTVLRSDELLLHSEAQGESDYSRVFC